VVRVQVPAKALGENIESFTMQFSNVKPSSCDLLLRWEKTEVALPITTEIESKIMAQIKNQMENDNRPYFAAAMYYMDNGKDLNKALEWFNKAAEQNPAFYILYQKAVCLSKLGRKQEAMTVSEQSTKAAMEAKSDDYVALNKKLQASLK
jgi:tetratricopeptide (TPR) repeat protein